MSLEEMAKAIHHADFCQAYRGAEFEDAERDWKTAPEPIRMRYGVLARAANKFYGFEGEPEEGCVRKARERLQALSVHSTHTQMMKCVEEAPRALGGKESE